MVRLPCAAVVVVSLVLAAAAPARGQTGPALLLKPLLSEEENFESRADLLVLDSAKAESADFDMAVLEASGRFRERGEKFIPRIGWDVAYYRLRSDIPVLDQDLTDSSVAVGLELASFNTWRPGLTVGVGYAGNAPFGESDAYYAKATLVAGRQLNAKSSLAFVIDYDGNRSYYPDIPLPGLVYRHQYDPTLSYTLGVPLSSITWRPDKPIMVEVTWTLLYSVDARIEYELSPAWLVFANVERRQEAFSVDGLSNHDRLLFEQQRAEVGVRWQPWEHTSLLLAGGYAFASEFSVGFDQRDSDKVADISDEPYVRVGFERHW